MTKGLAPLVIVKKNSATFDLLSYKRKNCSKMKLNVDLNS